MFFDLALFSIFAISVLDGSIFSSLLLMITYVIGLGVTYMIPNQERQQGQRVFNLVFVFYVTIAFIVSLSFSSTDHFLVSDSSRYIESYLNRRQFFYNVDDFVNCYLNFSDTNLLYNAYLNVVAMIANNNFGGLTIYGMTLCQTIWGILSAIVLYRIMARHFGISKAYRYTLYFALCSLFLFYSSVIIRDIVICFAYLVAFDVIDRKFSVRGVVILSVMIIIAWGVRLYSGIFAVAFLAYYIYINMNKGSLRHIATLIFALIMIIAAGSIISSSLMEQTMSELEGYEELSAERSAGGMVSRLQSLPPIISHFAIVLFTMVRPLPPFGIFRGVETFSNFVMSSMYFVSGFFWFVIFFSFLYMLIINKYIMKIPFEKAVLLLVCLVFMLANASHPDVRRMLPVFPVLFTQYAILCEHENETLFGWKIPKLLMTIYVALAIGLLIVM